MCFSYLSPVFPQSLVFYSLAHSARKLQLLRSVISFLKGPEEEDSYVRMVNRTEVDLADTPMENDPIMQDSNKRSSRLS